MNYMENTKLAILSSSQKEMVREFDRSTGDRNYQKRKSFFDKIKDAFKGDN